MVSALLLCQLHPLVTDAAFDFFHDTFFFLNLISLKVFLRELPSTISFLTLSWSAILVNSLIFSSYFSFRCFWRAADSKTEGSGLR